MNAYQLLSEIYRLIGEADERALSAALAHELAPEIRAVVTALSAARKSPSQGHRKEKNFDRGFSGSLARRTVVGETNKRDLDAGDVRVPPGVLIDDAASFEVFLNRFPRITNEQLAKVMSNSGLPVTYQRKESRERLIRRGVRLLQQMSRDKQLKVITSLSRRLEANQTEGWMNVIHSTNH